MTKFAVKAFSRKMHKINNLQNKLSIAIQDAESMLVYRNFPYDAEPSMGISSDNGDIILVWQGYEMTIIDAVRIMQEDGYIIPQDY